MGNKIVEDVDIFSIAMDPIYIGTGGFTIGRVDNTIVRDPTTKIPKIPGSSVAGTWRYYVVLELQEKIKDKQPCFDDIKKDGNATLTGKIQNTPWKNEVDLNDWHKFNGNKISRISCAGQDDLSNLTREESADKKGHCGHCIVCKGFGFSKKDLSWQGMLFFSDLTILYFPVYTRLGVKWITSKSIYETVIENKKIKNSENNSILTKEGNEKYLNLGWMNFKVSNSHSIEKVFPDSMKNIDTIISEENIVVVPDNLISQIINSNLEVRTSVSIDPITGAAKEKALFTSEAIPRGTIFYGKIRIFDRSAYNEVDEKITDLPSIEQLTTALEDSKHFYETLGIGGLTTRGFGRMKIINNFVNSVNSNNKNSGDGKNGK